MTDMSDLNSISRAIARGDAVPGVPKKKIKKLRALSMAANDSAKANQKYLQKLRRLGLGQYLFNDLRFADEAKLSADWSALADGRRRIQANAVRGRPNPSWPPHVGGPAHTSQGLCMPIVKQRQQPCLGRPSHAS